MSIEEKRDEIIEKIMDLLESSGEIINSIQENVETAKTKYKGNELVKVGKKLDELIRKTKDMCLEIP
ncbi:MAG: hypothetical protein HWN67_15210 [Candidatus Helarchaeota archaeon]|nr:hypothetical protein [Candidatus Helarchaeota archaeon]